MKNEKKSKSKTALAVRTIRKELGLTQLEFSEKLGLESDGKWISQIENDRGAPDRTLAEKMSALAKYPAPVAWIMGETDFRTDAERFRTAIQEVQLENDYMFAGLSLLAKLSGYAIEPPQLNGVHDAEAAIAAVKAGYFIEKDGASITLSLEEMNALENHVVNMVEAQLDFLFKLKGGAQNG